MNIKKITAIVLLFLISSSAIPDDRQDYCQHMKAIANAAMVAKHAGVPLKTMLLLVSDETAVEIFKFAYESPLEKSTADQQTAIAKFTELVLSQCLKS